MTVGRFSAFRSLPRRSRNGFFLLEALIAVSVIMIVVAALGALFSATMTGVRNAEQRTAMIQALRTVLTDLPNPSLFAPGTYSGTINGMRWKAVAQPRTDLPRLQKPSHFVPLSVLVTMTSANGTTLQIETARSMRDAGR